MHNIRLFSAVAAASALLAGCEWSGSSDSSSWSSSYDDMNFSGTYRSTSSATSESSSVSSSDESGTLSTHTETIKFSVSDQKTYSGVFSHVSGGTLVMSSVTISFSGEATSEGFTSDDSGTLTGSAGGTGKISGSGWAVNFPYPLTGSGTVTIKYQVNGTSSSTIVDTSSKTVTTQVTAVSVSQNGQNLVMRFNNGIQMDGRFTAVNRTSGSSDDSATSTYNAQFEVQSGNVSKFVGTLNYDIVSGYRTLDGSWTWGKNTYDIHGVGPSYR